MSHAAVPAEPDLADYLRLEDLGGQVYRARVFQANHNDAIYGGCLVGQALRAAELTAPGRVPLSLHGHFHRAGTSTQPIDYAVDLVRDGATFASRVVSGTQGGRLLFQATVAFHNPEPGFERAQAWAEPPPAPDPEFSPQALAERWSDRMPQSECDHLHVLGGLDACFIDAEDILLRPSAPTARIWVRGRRTREEPVSPYCAVAFISDFVMPGTTYLPFTRSIFDTSITTMSLDHAIWFHAPVRPNDWMMHEMESPWAGGGRGLSFGRIYSSDGVLLASTAQQILVRPPKPVTG